MRNKKYRTAFLGSTRGSVLKPILSAWELKRLPIDPVAIVTNREKAPILLRAREFEIPSFVISGKGKSREEYDREVSAILEEQRAEILVFTGYMRIVSPWFVRQWEGRVVNIHPSLLPRHAGLMNLDVHRAVLAAGDTETGCTLHHVEDVVDGGKIILQKRCPVLPEDTPETLKSKVQNLEAQAYLNLLQDPEEFLPALQNSACIKA